MAGAWRDARDSAERARLARVVIVPRCGFERLAGDRDFELCGCSCGAGVAAIAVAASGENR